MRLKKEVKTALGKVTVRAPTQGERQQLLSGVKDPEFKNPVEGLAFQTKLLSMCVEKAPFETSVEELEKLPGVVLDELFVEVMPMVGLPPKETRNLPGLRKGKSRTSG